MSRTWQPVTKTSVKSHVVAVLGEIDLLYLFCKRSSRISPDGSEPADIPASWVTTAYVV